jgi:predicted nucleic acid-binding Zn ribbon protein
MEETLRKVYTPVGIVFKGSGFYSTDNRSPSGSRPKKENSSTETNESDKKEKKDKTEKPKKAKED